jgi:hypothetical protein
MSNEIGAALQAALAGLVGGRVSSILLGDRPVYPAIRFLVASTRPDNTLCGQTNATVWLYRIDVYATTGKECGQIAASVKSIMRGFAYKNTHWMEMDGYEPETRVCRRTLDFNISDMEDSTLRV